MRAYIESYVSTATISPVLSLTQWSGPSSEFEDMPSYCDIPDPAPGADEVLDSIHLNEAIKGFVLSLVPRDREIVESVFWKGESQAGVARRFGVSAMAISKAMNRICRQGAQQLCAFRGCEMLR